MVTVKSIISRSCFAALQKTAIRVLLKRWIVIYIRYCLVSFQFDKQTSLKFLKLNKSVMNASPYEWSITKWSVVYSSAMSMYVGLKIRALIIITSEKETIVENKQTSETMFWSNKSWRFLESYTVGVLQEALY